MTDDFVLKTARLTLRPFQDGDSDAFAELNSDPDVMADLGGPFARAQSDDKLGRYITAARETEHSRLAIFSDSNEFLGYCGIMERVICGLGFHYDLGWRLNKRAWGHGYASEAARAVLRDALETNGLKEVLAYTGPDNLRSQKVMERLNLRRRPELDFSMELDGLNAPWTGWVWSAP
jgi:RimJ/RimL family protein N-acetyltransferase